jgi:imidazolonepropionase
VLLPGSTFFLREDKRPPLDAFRRHGVPIALATNCNPGSSPVLSPLLVMAMACTLFRMTPEEALRGFTANAARVLGRADRLGTLEAGKQADFVLWEVEEIAELAYWLGADFRPQVVQAGKPVAAESEPAPVPAAPPVPAAT